VGGLGPASPGLDAKPQGRQARSRTVVLGGRGKARGSSKPLLVQTCLSCCAPCVSAACAHPPRCAGPGNARSRLPTSGWVAGVGWPATWSRGSGCCIGIGSAADEETPRAGSRRGAGAAPVWLPLEAHQEAAAAQAPRAAANGTVPLASCRSSPQAASGSMAAAAPCTQAQWRGGSSVRGLPAAARGACRRREGAAAAARTQLNPPSVLSDLCARKRSSELRAIVCRLSAPPGGAADSACALR
jgi:hypothetical protein